MRYDDLGRNARAARDVPRLCFVMLLSAMALTGCREQPPVEPEALTKVAERGPYKYSVELSPRQVWVGDAVTIILRVETPEGALVHFPAAEDFGDLEISHVEDIDPRLGVEGGLVWRQEVSAASYASGTIEIPPLTIKYASPSDDEGVEPSFEHELSVDALQLEVLSALTSQDSVMSPRDITAALIPAPAPLSPGVWAAIIGGGALALALIALFIVWIRRMINRPARPVAPEIWALRQLSFLEADALVQQWRPKAFYYGLSEIVRTYIERQFRLAAPEMTTEEFLGALASDRGALPYDAGILREFLEACDLVKYAAFEPLPDDGQNAIGIARAFVDTTAATISRRSEREERAA